MNVLTELNSFVLAATLAYFISFVAFRNGFYQLPPRNVGQYGDIAAKVVGWDLVFIACGLFLTVQLILVPAFYLLWIDSVNGGGITGSESQIDSYTQGWLNLSGIILSALVLKLFYSQLSREVRQLILGKSSSCREVIGNWLIGMLTWVIAYPWTVALGLFIAALIHKIFGASHIDQIAVSNIKETLTYPGLFTLTIIAVVAVVPILEELLFRGFLQTFLKGALGRTKAIIITSMIFAMFHYSSKQGVENIELLAVLFMLSCFLGFIRERQQSLWASIGLHSTFNLISIVTIVLTSSA